MAKPTWALKQFVTKIYGKLNGVESLRITRLFIFRRAPHKRVGYARLGAHVDTYIYKCLHFVGCSESREYIGFPRVTSYHEWVKHRLFVRIPLPAYICVATLMTGVIECIVGIVHPFEMVADIGSGTPP